MIHIDMMYSIKLLQKLNRQGEIIVALCFPHHHKLNPFRTGKIFATSATAPHSIFSV